MGSSSYYKVRIKCEREACDIIILLRTRGTAVREKFIFYYSYYLCARRVGALKLCPKTYGLWASRDTVTKRNFRLFKAHGIRRYKVRARTQPVHKVKADRDERSGRASGKRASEGLPGLCGS